MISRSHFTPLSPTGEGKGVGEHQLGCGYPGITTGGGSDINSNDVLKEVRYPDASTGAASGSSGTVDKEQYTYNALGQVKTMTDQNGNVHTYSYDVLGRMTIDAVTTLGTGVDGTVRRQEVRYNTQGLADQFTQYDASSSGNVVNQVQRDFNGLGQMITEYQQIAGSVNTGTSPKVQYAYTQMVSSVNHSRLKSMTYPNGRILRYEYSAGLDADISRVSYLADDVSGAVGTHLEEYSYLGLSTIVERNHPESGINLTYVGTGTADAGDKYVGLDRFGRVVDHRWVDVAGAGTTDDRDADLFGYTYDRNSNRTSREWDSYQMLPTFKGDEVYSYDGLNRLTKADRGDGISGYTAGRKRSIAPCWAVVRERATTDDNCYDDQRGQRDAGDDDQLSPERGRK